MTDPETEVFDHKKHYLGDGAYIEFDQFDGVVITTSNGIENTNTIYLETSVMRNLIEWFGRNTDLITKQIAGNLK